MVATLALVLGLLLPPQQPTVDASAPRIFDGKTLNGWSGAPGNWSVADGCIIGNTMQSQIERNTFLIWQGGELADFVFECEVRIEGGNNSGIQYRSARPDPKTWTITGYQFDVHPEAALFGELYDEGGRGFLAKRGEQVICGTEGNPRVVGKVSEVKPVDLGQWHRFQVTARGTKLVHVVDGIITAECDDQFARAPRQGLLALQLHAGEPMRVFYRNLKLQILPREEVAVVAQEPATPPKWIWDATTQDKEEVFFRRAFTLGAAAKAGRVTVSCDNHCRVYINGERVGQSDAWDAPLGIDIGKQLKQGDNVVAVHGWNDGGPAGLAVRLSWETADGKRDSLASGADWRCSDDDPDGWDKPGFDDKGWAPVRVLYALGDAAAPWTAAVDATALDDAQLDAALPPPQPASELTLAPGWTATRLLRVPRRLGSWVSLAKDPQGRLYASDQGSGLYRLTLGADSAVTAIERVEVDLDGCHGLLWAHDCLYAVVNGNRSGLYRLTDTNADDKLDRVELLRKLDGEGEHGPHSIALDSDREHLLVLCGNHTKLTEITNSRLPRNWNEDLLLPRMDDPGGHAVGVMAPGGYLCRVDRNGKEWELITSGFRNAFDFGVMPDGEIYAYDADMEWDLGLPWYRPTRLCHCVSGAEFGWRHGSGKWPADYPDSLPPVCDIGPGSPTGVLVTGRGLYCLDWTFGTLYEVTPSNLGASAVSQPRQIASGQPWPLTDAVQVPGSDAMYVLTGGRGLPSALYRLDPPKDVPVSRSAPTAPGAELRALRRNLETFHGHPDSKAVAAAWQHLGNGDTFVRYAARLAVEWQPVAEWRARALAEATSPWASLTALLALARQGEPADLAPVLESLSRISFASLDPMQQVAWARVHALAFLRLGKPTGDVRDRTIAQLLALFPCGRDRSDQELCALLCALDAPAVVEKAMPLVLREGSPQPPVWADVVARNASYGGVIQRMMRDMPPASQIRMAYALRVVAHGWTLQQREAFFTFLKEARKKVGGASYGGYLSRIWQDAMANCTPAERAELAPVAGESLPTPPPFRATPPKGPGHDWQLEEAVAIAKRGLTGRDFQRGHNLFFATSCAACHRFAGEGGSMGPDLSSLGNKFGASDVLEAILQPSKVVSDQYAGVVLTKKDGTTLFGRFQRSKIEGKEVYTGILASADAKRLTIPADEVQRMENSKLSPMPTGLVTPLNESELLDLLAFLLSRGDDKSPMFAR